MIVLVVALLLRPLYKYHVMMMVMVMNCLSHLPLRSVFSGYRHVPKVNKQTRWRGNLVKICIIPFVIAALCILFRVAVDE